MKNTLVEKLGIAAIALSMNACASKPYTQLQYAQGKGVHYRETGRVDLSCGRVRGGGKTARSKHTNRQEEFRLGIDVCYSQFPTVVAVDSFGINASIIKEETSIQSVTKQYQIKLSPIAEYKLITIGANFEKENPKRKKYPNNPEYIPFTEKTGLLIPGYKDLELSLWLGLGYNLDITAKSTDFTAGKEGNNQINNIPGIDIDGQFFGEFSQEVVLLGRFVFGTGIRVDRGDESTRYHYLFNGGYRIQW